MSDTNNNDSIAPMIAELGSKLKEEFLKNNLKSK